ncbi:hypothetical protein Rhopal_001524-T1 [Rhodotorula paludigena]|uniref:Uncharacterized protein n=1 Tax=Rhodotorula paludigena TaxID=86838 RepID=A0AAV5GEL1_9BASI|nr:hypothetical protein Rhopal_001524-T1 [Rhodotorula paludigena]
MQIYLEALTRKEHPLSAESAHGYAWLFCRYRQPELARQAAVAMHDRGLAVSPALAGKILRMSHRELVFQPDALARVFAWFNDGLARETADGVPVDTDMLETTFDVLKRMGRSDWLDQIFASYRRTLKTGEVGSPRLWSLAISSKTHENDYRAAERLFEEWRSLQLAARNRSASQASCSDSVSTASAPAPPSEPYLALLSYYGAATSSHIAARDPAYRLVALAVGDGVVVSTNFLNALLRIELHRSRFASFWGLWAQFESLKLKRDRVSWQLAVRAKSWIENMRRKRGRVHNSPLHEHLPFTYEEAFGPSSRDLFRSIIENRLAETGHRPSRLLSTKQPDHLTSSLLNSFVDLFIARRDYQAAVVVLETFSVHRLEPDQHTHGSVVLGVVRQWQRGQLRGRSLVGDESPASSAPPKQGRAPYMDLGALEREEEQRRRGAILGGPQGVDLIRRILEGRKMRVGLWGSPASSGTVGDGEGKGEESAAEAADEVSARPPPAWMVQRELRDLGYLVQLLRRCTGLSEAEWGKAMVDTRREMLPGKASKKVKRVDRITRGARYREWARGEATKV